MTTRQWNITVDYVSGQGWEAAAETEGDYYSGSGWEARDAGTLLAAVARDLQAEVDGKAEARDIYVAVKDYTGYSALGASEILGAFTTEQAGRDACQADATENDAMPSWPGTPAPLVWKDDNADAVYFVAGRVDVTYYVRLLQVNERTSA